MAVLLTALGCLGKSSESGDRRSTNAVFGVVTGQIEQITDSVGIFVWGDPANQLCQQWSIALFDQSGRFFGTSNSWSSADVYVLAAPGDPLTIVAAETLI